MKTRYVRPLIQLARRESLSITQLAAAALLTRVVADIAVALERRPFRQRLVDHLDTSAGEET